MIKTVGYLKIFNFEMLNFCDIVTFFPVTLLDLLLNKICIFD